MVVGPLPEHEYHEIYSKVPRLNVELIIESEQGVVLTQRRSGPCAGLWHLPGGTVRYGEPLRDAVARVGLDELGVRVAAGAVLGYVEYPSHLNQGIDWPVGIAFKTTLGSNERLPTGDDVTWSMDRSLAMHDEQRSLLRSLGVEVASS